MYTFSSAVRDMQKSLMDNDIVFSFSKFALLDLPNVDTLSSAYDNKIVWNALTGAAPYINNDLNIAESIENYLLNQEEFIINSYSTSNIPYDSTLLQTVSERLFWKWLTKINAIKFNEAPSLKTNLPNRFVEYTDAAYNSVVKYIGNIDVVNNTNIYTEVYMHIPSNHGNTPTILFKTLNDNNYQPSLEWFTGNDNIDGRSESSIHPAGLSLNAIYDNMSSKMYVAGPSFGLTTFTDVAVPGGTAKISNMDGVVLDFDKLSYSEIASTAGINNFGDFNASAASNNFNFNVVLVYYNLYKQSDATKVFTNLYGILVLDNYINQGDYAELKRFNKFKANTLTGLNGNSYSLKFNIKIDASVSNLGIDKVINDYNTFSMELFSDAMMQVKTAASMFESQSIEMISIKNRLTNLENFYFSQDDLNAVNNRILQVEKSITSANMAFGDKNTLLKLINANSDNINLLLSGNLSTSLTYNTDVIQPGAGIEIDKSVKNKLKITSTQQRYNPNVYCKNSTGTIEFTIGNGDPSSTINGNVIPLQEFTNYYKYDVDSQTLTSDLIINIEDNFNKWKLGQSIKFYFDKTIDLNGNTIIIKSDFANSYKIIAVIDNSNIMSTKPIIELVCVDSTNLKFDTNILR
jgi:hypothetical protein